MLLHNIEYIRGTPGSSVERWLLSQSSWAPDALTCLPLAPWYQDLPQFSMAFLYFLPLDTWAADLFLALCIYPSSFLPFVLLNVLFMSCIFSGVWWLFTCESRTVWGQRGYGESDKGLDGKAGEGNRQEDPALSPEAMAPGWEAGKESDLPSCYSKAVMLRGARARWGAIRVPLHYHTTYYSHITGLQKSKQS